MTTAFVTQTTLTTSQRVMIELLKSDNDNRIDATELAARFGQSKPNHKHTRTLQSLVRLGLVRRSGSLLHPIYSLI